MTVANVFWAVLILGLLLVVSRVIRQKTTVFRRIFLPSSVIAGVLGLLLGPQVLGLAVAMLPEGLFPEEIQAVWRALPGLLINVVFGALLLGKAIPGLREIWRTAGPQVVVGQTIAWGQYVVGLGLAVLVLGPVFGLPPVVGALIEIGFEGGHGTAAGMREAFEAVGFDEGFDLAVAMATIGLVGGVLVGTALINWGARRGFIAAPESVDSLADVSLYRPPATEAERRAEAGELAELRREKDREMRPTDPLSLHLGIVAIAIGIGWLLREALLLLERATWGGPVPGEEPLLIVAHVPLFPLAMIGGVIVQLAIDRLGLGDRVSRRLMNRISGASLDLIIVGAIATLSLQALGENLIPILLLATLGTVWSLSVVVFLAPRVVPTHWFERATGDFGQSMGVTVTGLLLMRVADPPNRSGALESFGYKQLLFEPVVGGGLFTGSSVALIAAFGAGPILIVTLVLTGFWILFGLWAFGAQSRANREAERRTRERARAAAT
jgi:glutamate:Na+ symporter, ESS family